MDLLGKKKLLEQLHLKAQELREWMLEHTSPETPAHVFEKVANQYAITCTRMYIIEKNW